jgi:hypothetical protein
MQVTIHLERRFFIILKIAISGQPLTNIVVYVVYVIAVDPPQRELLVVEPFFWISPSRV